MKNKKMLCIKLLCGAGVIMSLAACGGNKKPSEEEDPTKANITIATFDGGVGSKWLTDAAKIFEEKFKNATDFQEGRTGVKVNVIASRNYTGSYLLESSLNKDIYFTENVDYINCANTGKFADLTQVLTSPLTDYGENKTILSKIDSNFASFLNKNGSYYAVPFYDAFYGFIYDIDLWEEKGFYIKDVVYSGETITSITYTDDVDEASKGPDGVSGTIDDGMPATFAEFEKLISKLKAKEVTPLSYSSKYDEYVLRTMTNYWANIEGLDNMQLNYSFSGQADNLVKSIEGRTATVESKAITFDNGYDLQKQAGKFYALDFLSNILCADVKNYSAASTHTAAQSAFVEGKYYDSPIGFLVDGSWWENEAVEAFQSLQRIGEEKGNYAIMPMPFASKEMIGNKQTTMSQNTSYGMVAANSANLKLALEFMKFLHTDTQLSAFTAETSMTRALNYEVVAEDQSKVTTYGASLINLKKENNVVYPYSALPSVINNADFFTTDTWAWKTSIDGKIYNDPLKYFTQSQSLPANPAKTYFDGLYTYYYNNWKNLK